LYQYWRGQRLQKAKFATELTDRLYADEELQAASNFIDWKDCELVLPKKYSTDGAPAKFNHRLSNLHTAMSLESRHILDDHYSDLKEEYRRPGYTEYVAIFDRFFSFIEGIDGFYRSRSVELQHIPQVIYLLDRLDKMDHDKKKIFEEYLVYYDYDRVVYMMEIAHLCLDERERLPRLLIRWRARYRKWQRISSVRHSIRERLQTRQSNTTLINSLTSAV
jgi:hypothetical protein